MLVYWQVLLHEATLRLMTGANPSSHALYTVRCRRRRLDQCPNNCNNDNDNNISPVSASASTVSDDYLIYDDDDDDDDDDDENVVFDRKTT